MILGMLYSDPSDLGRSELLMYTAGRLYYRSRPKKPHRVTIISCLILVITRGCFLWSGSI